MRKSRHLFSSLTHVTANGLPTMVDISQKQITLRRAVAQGKVYLPDAIVSVLRLDDAAHTDIEAVKSKKGPVLTTAIIAGVQAVKKTSEIIPFCHPIPIDDANITIKYENKDSQNRMNFFQITCEVKTTGKTGVEMEALTGVSASALCIYDMLKAISHDMEISDIRIVSKSGGKSDIQK